MRETLPNKPIAPYCRPLAVWGEPERSRVGRQTVTGRVRHIGVNTMRPYRDINGDSGTAAYEYGEDWIRVQFKHGSTYEYRSSRIGSVHLNTMKRLADSGDGLNTYINTNPDVKKGYSHKT